VANFSCQRSGAFPTALCPLATRRNPGLALGICLAHYTRPIAIFPDPSRRNSTVTHTPHATSETKGNVRIFVHVYTYTCTGIGLY
jgi:hypothetical protein